MQFIGDQALHVLGLLDRDASVEGMLTDVAAPSSAPAGSYNGSASVAATATVTATGVVARSTGASVAATATITATGVVGKAAGASVAGTASITAAGVVGKVTGSAVSGTAAITATGVVGRTTGASVAATATITATGVVGTGATNYNGTASIQATVTITATGVVTVLPVYRLVNLTSQQVWTSNILLGRYSMEQGNTLLYRAGTVTVTDSPMDTDLEDADWYILGGHDRTLTASQVDDLTAAGYGSLVETA